MTRSVKLRRGDSLPPVKSGYTRKLQRIVPEGRDAYRVTFRDRKAEKPRARR